MDQKTERKKPLRLTDDNFEREVLESDIPVLVEFWSSWCPPCKMMEPVMDELAEELSGKVKVAKLNVDQNSAIPARYTISGVPTFVVFDKSKEMQRYTGAQSKKQLYLICNAGNLL